MTEIIQNLSSRQSICYGRGKAKPITAGYTPAMAGKSDVFDRIKGGR
jgi:hypothetical protein